MLMTKAKLRQFILDKFPLKDGKLTTDPLRWCQRNYPELIDIINSAGEYDKFSDNVYSILWNTINRCNHCGKLISLTWKTREQKYCSRKCMAASEQWRDKYKQTCLERHGTENPRASKQAKEKYKQTCMERYGVENAAQSKEVIDKITATFQERYGVKRASQHQQFKDKYKQTCIERYGVEHPFQHQHIKDKRCSTMKERYGVAYSMQSAELRQKAVETSIARFGVPNPMQNITVRNQAQCTRLGILYSDTPVKSYLESLGYNTDKPLLVGPTKYGMLSPALIEAQLSGTVSRDMLMSEYSDYNYAMRKLGMPTSRLSNPHAILAEFLDSIGVEYAVNLRTVIKPKELDIYIPAHKLAIEINGLYWHSTDVPMRDTQHIDKFNMCQQQGIKLLQFTDADILHRRDLVHSMILAKLGKLPSRIYARKCSIVSIASKDAHLLLDQWHYQGRTTGRARFIALQHESSIVAVLGYTVSNSTLRIERYACELNTNVVGGYSKLEKHAIKLTLPGTIETFSLGLISDGALYANNGYECVDGYASKPEWYVTDNITLFNRQRFMKSKMQKLFGNGFSPAKTEWQNIVDNGLRLYFGAGITKWVKVLK